MPCGCWRTSPPQALGVEHAGGRLHEFDAWVGFFPLYGFVGAFLLVLAAKQMRRVLMRPEDYYERRGGGKDS